MALGTEIQVVDRVVSIRFQTSDRPTKLVEIRPLFFSASFRAGHLGTILDPALDQSPALADPGSDDCQRLEVEGRGRFRKLEGRLSWRPLSFHDASARIERAASSRS